MPLQGPKRQKDSPAPSLQSKNDLPEENLWRKQVMDSLKAWIQQRE